MDVISPFGGVKQSGIGRNFGIDGIKQFQDVHSIQHPWQSDCLIKKLLDEASNEPTAIMSIKRIRALERGLVVIEGLSQSRPIADNCVPRQGLITPPCCASLQHSLIEGGRNNVEKYELSRSLEKLGSDSTGS